MRFALSNLGADDPLAALMKKVPKMHYTAASDAAEKIKLMAPTFYRNGWKTAHITYDGYGDSTEEWAVRLENEEGLVDLENVTFSDESLKKELDEALWGLVPSGFENEDGGFGEITVQFDTGKILHTHGHRYTSVEETVHEY